MTARKAKQQQAKMRRRHRSWLAQSRGFEEHGDDVSMAQHGRVHRANQHILHYCLKMVGTEMGDRAAYVLGLYHITADEIRKKSSSKDAQATR